MSTTHLGLQTTNTYFIFGLGLSFRYTPTMLPVSQVSETQKTGVLLRAPCVLVFLLSRQLGTVVNHTDQSQKSISDSKD
jgi:hypothetical protein